MNASEKKRIVKLAIYKEIKKQNTWSYYVALGKKEIENAGLKKGDTAFVTIEVDEE